MPWRTGARGAVGRAVADPTDQSRPPLNAFACRAFSAAVPVGVVAFWVGMFAAAKRYPAEYDWRYATISSLVYPERNPAGHLWASTGIALCGLLGLGWIIGLASTHPPRGDRRFAGWVWALAVGYGCMAAAAALPERLVPVPKGHEILALTSFFCLCGGAVRLTYLRLTQTLSKRRTHSAGAVTAYAGIIAGLALAPIALAAIAQAYVSYALPSLPWVNLSWRSLGVPAYLSFGFWEWVTCAVLSCYTVGFSLLTRNVEPT